jgi:hypothetical protein
VGPAALCRTSLRAIHEQLPPGGLDFASPPATEQDAFLSELEAGRLDLGGFSSAIFFETLLANTIEGFSRTRPTAATVTWCPGA